MQSDNFNAYLVNKIHRNGAKFLLSNRNRNDAIPIWWHYTKSKIHFVQNLLGVRRGHDHMVVGFTTTCAISAYHHKRCEFESRSDEVYSIQHYVIKFVSYLRQVRGFLRVLRFPLPIKLTTRIYQITWYTVLECFKLTLFCYRTSSRH